MIIIEGPEGSGKSYLAKQLAEATDLPVHHFGGPPKSAEEHARQLKKSMQLLDTLVIQDRSPWVSEPVYNVALRSEEHMVKWPHYWSGIILKKMKIIYCRPPDETIRLNLCKAPKGYKSEDYEELIKKQSKVLITTYDLFMSRIKPWVVYDWTAKKGADRVRAKMVKFCEKRKEKLTDLLISR